MMTCQMHPQGAKNHKQEEVNQHLPKHEMSKFSMDHSPAAPLTFEQGIALAAGNGASASLLSVVPFPSEVLSSDYILLLICISDFNVLKYKIETS